MGIPAKFGALALVLFLFVPDLAAYAAVSGAENNTERGYPSASERAALEQIAAEIGSSSNSGEAKKQETDPAVMLQGMRAGFENFSGLLETLPPMKIEPYALKDVKGVWFIPQKAADDQVLLYFHGGAYVFGSPRTAGCISGLLAHLAKIRCFSLDYPLAPEEPFPAAVNNALAAYQMLLDRGYKPEKIVLAGDSAGGGLTLATLLKIRENALPMPAGAYLLSPWTNLSHDFASITAKQKADSLIDCNFLKALAPMYAGKENLKNPLISPAFADLTGFPPLFIQVGSHEILLDDALTVAHNASLANVFVRTEVWPEYFHVFQMFHGRLEGGRRALHNGAEFLQEAIKGTLLKP